MLFINPRVIVAQVREPLPIHIMIALRGEPGYADQLIVLTVFSIRVGR